jgi:hypothetical protein
MKNYFKNEIHNYFSGCLHVIRKKGIVPPKEMEIFFFVACPNGSVALNFRLTAEALLFATASVHRAEATV